MVSETFPVGFKVFYVVDFGHGELGFFELFFSEELLFIDLFFWGILTTLSATCVAGTVPPEAGGKK